MIELECPSCGQLLELDAGFAGGVCRCSDCGTLMTVPKHPDREDAAPAPRPDSPLAVTPIAKRAPVAAGTGQSLTKDKGQKREQAQVRPAEQRKTARKVEVEADKQGPAAATDGGSGSMGWGVSSGVLDSSGPHAMGGEKPLSHVMTGDPPPTHDVEDEGEDSEPSPEGVSTARELTSRPAKSRPSRSAEGGRAPDAPRSSARKPRRRRRSGGTGQERWVREGRRRRRRRLFVEFLKKSLMALLVATSLGGTLVGAYYLFELQPGGAGGVGGSSPAFDPSVNPLLDEELSFFQVPLERRVVVAIESGDADGSVMRACRRMVLRMARRMPATSQLQVVYWYRDGQLAVPRTGPEPVSPRVIEQLIAAQEVLPERGHGSPAPAVEMAVATNCDQIILLAQSPPDESARNAIEGALALNTDTRLDIILMGPHSLDTQLLAERHRGRYLKIPVEQVRTWLAQAEQREQP